MKAKLRPRLKLCPVALFLTLLYYMMTWMTESPQIYRDGAVVCTVASQQEGPGLDRVQTEWSLLVLPCVGFLQVLWFLPLTLETCWVTRSFPTEIING